MSEKVRILSFYENWVDIMEMCNPEEWYELSTIITNLRFKNVDTDPKTLTNIKVKMAWTAIRPSILKSNRNTRYQENKAKKNTDITPNEEFDNTMITVFPTKKEEEQQTDTKDAEKVEIEAQNADLNDNFDNYSERLYNLIDDNITKIRQSTDILAQKQIELGSQIDNTVAFHRNVLYELRKQLGWDTKDGIDFQQFIDEEINRKTAQIRYGRAIQSSYNS